MTRCKAVTSCAIALVCAAQACTWTRFDDITDNPPVEEFETPNGTTSLGLAMATYPTATGTTLAVAATDRIVIYDLGTGSEPSRTALASQDCVGDNTCILTRHMAGLKAQPITANEGCVAYGVGAVNDSSGTSLWKLWLYCEDATRHSLDLPQTLTDWFSGRVVNAQTFADVATTRHSGIQPLVASMPDAATIWYYDGANPTPVVLPSLPNDQSAGRALAVLVTDSVNIVAASSVTPDDTIWFFQIDANVTPTLIGCVQGQSQFGRLLTTGNFDDDGIDDLVVADATSIYVIAGSSLAAWQPSDPSSCASIDSLQVLAQAGCANLPNLQGCVGQTFASAIAAANLDGTGPDELVVGVPDTIVRGETAAGAVFIYALHDGNLTAEDGLYVSSASAGDQLGTSVATSPVAGVDAGVDTTVAGIIAGAPGDNAVMAFYCNSLMPAEAKSARCP